MSNEANTTQTKPNSKGLNLQFSLETNAFQPADLLNKPLVPSFVGGNPSVAIVPDHADGGLASLAQQPVVEAKKSSVATGPVLIPGNLQFYREKTNAPIVVNPILSHSGEKEVKRDEVQHEFECDSKD